MNAKVGELVRLDAKVVGTKPIDVYWGKNGAKVTTDITHKILDEDDTNTLLILESTMADQGTYECIAVNSVGEARCSAQVTIVSGPASPRAAPVQPKQPVVLPIAPPQVLEPLKEVVVKEGEAATFKTRISNASGQFPHTFCMGNH